MKSSTQQINKALAELKAHRGQLTRQQLLTLRGQVLAGDPDGAMQGLRNILQRAERKTTI